MAARSSSRLISAVAWAVLLLGLWVWGRDLTTGGPTLPGDGSPVRLADGSPLPPALRPLPGDAAPQRVEIAQLGIRAEVIPRGVDAGGGVEPPSFETPDLAGWYADGPTPGAEGAALLVGHVDTETSPAVFYNLSAVEPGAQVRVVREDGSVAAFTVERVEVVERGDFDAERVYGPGDGGRAELRLITCGGRFDATARTYSANVVVSAYLTGTGAL